MLWNNLRAPLMALLSLAMSATIAAAADVPYKAALSLRTTGAAFMPAFTPGMLEPAAGKAYRCRVAGCRHLPEHARTPQQGRIGRHPGRI